MAYLKGPKNTYLILALLL